MAEPSKDPEELAVEEEAVEEDDDDQWEDVSSSSQSIDDLDSFGSEVSEEEEEEEVEEEEEEEEEISSDSSEYADDSTEEAYEPCLVCDEERAVPCSRCELVLYCSEECRREDKKGHKRVCFPQVKSTLQKCDEAAPAIHQDSPLLKLPTEVLLRVCRGLPVGDLVRLGQVCRALRSVCRDPHAWELARFPDRSCDFLWRGNRLGLLRIAPCLHTLDAGYLWPEFDLRVFTGEVKVFELDWDGYMNEPYDVKKLCRLLRHYKGRLQVLKLGWLEEMDMLRFIDRLGVHELYMGRTLVKAYPGSTKVVREIKIGYEVTGDVLASFLRACRETLVSFRLDPYKLNKNPWANDDHRSPVYRALRRCSALQQASVTTWGRASLLDSFPQLHTLCLFDLDYGHHKDVVSFFKSSPVARGLRCLTLHLGYFGHRGLIKAAAEGCSGLRELRLMFQSTDRMTATVTVDVPRDLHVILGLMGDLEKLTLSIARVPFTVFRGIADGALPNLKVLNLNLCGVTQKARAALETLVSRRPELAVRRERLQPARPQLQEWGWLARRRRCRDRLCRPPSESDERDPIISEPRSAKGKGKGKGKAKGSRAEGQRLDWFEAIISSFTAEGDGASDEDGL